MVSAAFKYVPQTTATTFAFSSVFILLLCPLTYCRSLEKGNKYPPWRHYFSNLWFIKPTTYTFVYLYGEFSFSEHYETLLIRKYCFYLRGNGMIYKTVCAVLPDKHTKIRYVRVQSLLLYIKDFSDVAFSSKKRDDIERTVLLSCDQQSRKRAEVFLTFLALKPKYCIELYFIAPFFIFPTTLRIINCCKTFMFPFYVVILNYRKNICSCSIIC